MKKIMLALVLMLSFSAMANDKIAYIVIEIEKDGYYELCENTMDDLFMTKELVEKRVLADNRFDLEQSEQLEFPRINENDQYCYTLSVAYPF